MSAKAFHENHHLTPSQYSLHRSRAPSTRLDHKITSRIVFSFSLHISLSLPLSSSVDHCRRKFKSAKIILFSALGTAVAVAISQRAFVMAYLFNHVCFEFPFCFVVFALRSLIIFEYNIKCHILARQIFYCNKLEMYKSITIIVCTSCV